MTGKIRIGILGIGGVGGYFGGLLAHKYYGSGEVEIVFITRPATGKIIREKGLKLITSDNEKIIFPDVIATESASVGPLDYLVCCVKSYDLEESILPLGKSIHENTMILPLLNGVDAKERIAEIYPRNEILDGCVYIISQLAEPGVVRQTGIIHKLFFGSDSADPGRLKQLEQILLQADIECILSDNIQETIWEKFIFISSLASLTSLLNLSIGDILKDEAHTQNLAALISELISIAEAHNVRLPADIAEKTMAKMERLPYETTSSMHRDFQKGGKTEYLSLTAFVVDYGRRLNIETPEFDKILKAFEEKNTAGVK